jgi:alpha-L-fucosidase
MNPNFLIVTLLAVGGVAQCSHAGDPIPETLVPKVIVNTAAEPIAPGKFQPTWNSLKQYQTPDWFRNAKFGIWAH